MPSSAFVRVVGAALALALSLRVQARAVRVAASAVGIVLLVQLTIGVLTVVKGVRLSLAVMHNAGAAVLLLAIFALNYVVQGQTVRGALCRSHGADV